MAFNSGFGCYAASVASGCGAGVRRDATAGPARAASHCSPVCSRRSSKRIPPRISEWMPRYWPLPAGEPDEAAPTSMYPSTGNTREGGDGRADSRIPSRTTMSN